MSLIFNKIVKQVRDKFDNQANDYFDDVFINSDDWIELCNVARKNIHVGNLLDHCCEPVLYNLGYRGYLYGCTIKEDNNLKSIIYKYSICG